MPWEEQGKRNKKGLFGNGSSGQRPPGPGLHLEASSIFKYSRGFQENIFLSLPLSFSLPPLSQSITQNTGTLGLCIHCLYNWGLGRVNCQPWSPGLPTDTTIKHLLQNFQESNIKFQASLPKAGKTKKLLIHYYWFQGKFISAPPNWEVNCQVPQCQCPVLKATAGKYGWKNTDSPTQLLLPLLLSC